jgi:hypothetical protein
MIATKSRRTMLALLLVLLPLNACGSKVEAPAPRKIVERPGLAFGDCHVIAWHQCGEAHAFVETDGGIWYLRIDGAIRMVESK